MLNTQFIEATTLSDAWFQTLFRILEEGEVYTIDRGSYAGQKRLEFFNVIIDINSPGIHPLLPQIPEQYSIPKPVDENYLDDYLPYLMTGELKEGESYTYGQRLTKYPISYPIDNYNNSQWKHILIQDDIYNNDKIIIKENGKLYLNQIELLIWVYQNKGHRNNQMVLQIAHPTDMLLQDPPCLRSIDTRIQEGKLHFFPYFRSWDLWNGLPANLAAIQMLKEYVSGQIGVADGKLIASSKGLHIYDYAFDLAKCLRMKEDLVLKDGC